MGSASALVDTQANTAKKLVGSILYCSAGKSSVIPWGVIIWIIVLLILIVIMIFIIIKYWPKRGVHRPPSRPLDPLDTDPPRGAHGNY